MKEDCAAWAARERGTTRNKDRERTGNLLAAVEVQLFHVRRKLQLRDVACSGRKEGKKGRRSKEEVRLGPHGSEEQRGTKTGNAPVISSQSARFNVSMFAGSFSCVTSPMWEERGKERKKE